MSEKALALDNGPALGYDRDDTAVECINHPSGFLALNSKNERFSREGLPGFVSYRRQGRHLIAFGGFHSLSRPSRETLADEFLRFANSQGLGVVVVQARQQDVGILRDRGFAVSQFGSSFATSLPDHSLKGTAKMKLRNKINRAHRAGLDVVELGRELPKGAVTFQCLNHISVSWLAAKRKKELDFMIGEIGSPDEARRRIFVVRDPNNNPLAFITYVPAWCERPGVLHDLTRRHPDAPPGALELCNHFAMERFRQEGIGFLHFGFTPFIVDDSRSEGDSPFLSWFIRKMHCHGAAIYPARTQAQYKLKWGIDFIEREYVAVRPFRARAVLDLLILTRSI